MNYIHRLEETFQLELYSNLNSFEFSLVTKDVFQRLRGGRGSKISDRNFGGGRQQDRL
jgi:hypothetical protein